MAFLIIGLVLFLGAHSLRIFTEDWRQRQITRLGAKRWKNMLSLVLLLGFILTIYGYGQARSQTAVIWTPPATLYPLTSLLTLLAFVLLAAASVPNNAIKAKLGHPMIIGVGVWAFAHLLSNGTVASAVLFGAFLVWALIDYRAARVREPAASMGIAAKPAATAMAVVAGVVVWAAFAFFLHGWLIGSSPV